ncbi:hypothetical protein FQZ97_984390 [compost metagenome]
MVAAGFGDVEEVDLVFGHEIHHQAAGVTQVRGPDDRQHQEGSFGDPVVAQGLAEVFVLPGQAHAGGGIPQAGHANRGVEQQASGDLHGALAAQLQDAVEQVGHIAQVAEEVADAAAHHPWRDEGVAAHHGQEHPFVEAVVEVVDAPVPGLEGVEDVQRVQGGAFELALIQARVELQLLERLGETVRVGFLGACQAAGQQQCDQECFLIHGRTPAWRRR